MLNCSSGSGQDLSALASLPSLIGRLAVCWSACLNGCLPVRRLHKSNQINTFINFLANRKMPSLFQAIWTHGSQGNLSCPTRVVLSFLSPRSPSLSVHSVAIACRSKCCFRYLICHSANTTRQQQLQQSHSNLSTDGNRLSALHDPCNGPRERTRESRHYVRRLSCRRVKFPLPVPSAAWN